MAESRESIKRRHRIYKERYPERVKESNRKYREAHPVERKERRPDAERFLSKVDKGESCWTWKGWIDGWGYGKFRYRGRMMFAHRFSYMTYREPVPDGLCVLHRCDNPACVNPAHLFLGTQGDNAKDKMAKNRHTFGEKSKRSKLTLDQVMEIRRSTGNQRLLAEKYGIRQTTVSEIRNGRSWSRAIALATGGTP